MNTNIKTLIGKEQRAKQLWDDITQDWYAEIRKTNPIDFTRRRYMRKAYESARDTYLSAHAETQEAIFKAQNNE